MVVSGMSHALGFVFGCVVCIGYEVGCLVIGCIWYGDVMRLVVGFGWIDIVVGFGNGVRLVVGRGFCWVCDEEARWCGSIKYLGSYTNCVIITDLNQFI